MNRYAEYRYAGLAYFAAFVVKTLLLSTKAHGAILKGRRKLVCKRVRKASAQENWALYDLHADRTGTASSWIAILRSQHVLRRCMESGWSGSRRPQPRYLKITGS